MGDFSRRCSGFLARAISVRRESKGPINGGCCPVVQSCKPLKRFPSGSIRDDQAMVRFWIPAVETAGYNHFIPSGFLK